MTIDDDEVESQAEGDAAYTAEGEPVEDSEARGRRSRRSRKRYDKAKRLCQLCGSCKTQAQTVARTQTALEALTRNLREGLVSTESIPPLVVLKFAGKYFVVCGNRKRAVCEGCVTKGLATCNNCGHSVSALDVKTDWQLKPS